MSFHLNYPVMNTIGKLETWFASKKAPVWMDIIRFFLGIYIFYKGFIFTMNFEDLTQNIATINVVFLTIPTAHYIALAHLMGGILIVIGAYTRVATLINFPVLIGAVIFNYGAFGDDPLEFEMALTVLVLLALFIVYGGGRLSIDEIKRQADLLKETQA